MKIRDLHATINGDKTEYTMPSGGLEVISSDGRPLFTIRQVGENNDAIEIRVGGVVQQGKILLDDILSVTPRSSNSIIVTRPRYK